MESGWFGVLGARFGTLLSFGRSPSYILNNDNGQWKYYTLKTWNYFVKGDITLWGSSIKFYFLQPLPLIPFCLFLAFLRGSRFLRALVLVHLLSNHIQLIELCPLSILITGLAQNLLSPLSQVRLLAYKNFSKEAVGFAFLFPFLISFWGIRDREGGWKHNYHFLVLIIDAFLLTWVDCGCCLCARCPESDSLMEYIIGS